MSSIPNSDITASAKVYALDNAGREAVARFPALSSAFDEGTERHLTALGVGPGWRCLEVGGGGGSIAGWMADRVGPTGHVVVTDIDPRFLTSWHHPRIEVRVDDISASSLPASTFDLVHSRLVLLHVPEREKALAHMIAALKPGGWLLDEEFDGSIFPDPSLSPGESLSKTHIAATRILDERGVDRTFGRRLFGRLRSLGLRKVAAEGRTFMWHANSPGAILMRANYEQLQDEMIAAGYVTQAQFESDVAALEDPDYFMPAPVLWAAWGQRPLVGA